MRSDYWGEFATYWRALVSATLGLGFGAGLGAYAAGVFAPQLLHDFGWQRSQFALLGSIGLLMLVLSPVVGRLTDRFGVRAVAGVGVIMLPLVLFSYTLMNGDIRVYFALNFVQLLFGALTTTPVYTRLVAERFVKARGLAFGIVACGPPLAGAILAPILGRIVATDGWRTGYGVYAAIALSFGIVAIALMPARKPDERAAAAQRGAVGGAEHKAARKSDRALIIGNPAFWILVGAMVLANIPQGVYSAQLAVMLASSGASIQLATLLVSAFAVGVIIGRFLCGFALDRMEAHLVAAVVVGAPAIGLVLIASPLDTPLVLAISVMLMGLAYGAEGDVAAYIVAQRFPVRVFSGMMGFVGTGISAGVVLGSFGLSLTLRLWHEDYTPFLLIGAAATIAAGALLLTLGPRPQANPEGLPA
jgi:MFS family permease